MKVGSLVTVCPARESLYLVLGVLPDQEINWPSSQDGIPLGRLWELYESSGQGTKTMYEKFIEVVSESR